jgi:integrase
MKTYNNRRGILSTFIKFAFQRGWIAENPIPKVPHYRIRRKRGVARTFTATQARALMEHVETCDGGCWVPYFALCLFAGIRPGVPHGEITKLKPDAVNLDEGIIHISAEVSKVREPCKVTIPPNLAAWLRAYGTDHLGLGREYWSFVFQTEQANGTVLDPDTVIVFVDAVTLRTVWFPTL